MTIATWYHPGGRERYLLPDTHAHLDAPVFTGQHEAIIERAAAAGVDRILAVGSDLASSEMAVGLAHRFEMVYAAVGVHPHEVTKFDGEAAAVCRLLRESKVVAVGEIGLDFYRGESTRELQREAFREQLGWAREAGLPVSVHNRLADEEVLGELEEAGVRAVLHCFSSGAEVARRAMEGGHYLSFAGNVTFPKASDLRAVAADVPPDRVLVESDAPVLAPQPWRGRTNEPSYVTATARTLAEVRGDEVEDLCAEVTRNADLLFGWRAS